MAYHSQDSARCCIDTHLDIDVTVEDWAAQGLVIRIHHISVLCIDSSM